MNDKAKLNIALREARGEAKAAKAEVETMASQVKTLAAERDTLATTAKAGPEDLLKQVAELKGQLSTRDHRDAFRQAASAAGVAPAAMDDLYSLSGLKPGDAPAKPEDFSAYFTEAKNARPWAFTGESASAGSQTATPNQGAASQGLGLVPTVPPPGSGRGASDRSSVAYQVRRSDLGNGLWMQANQSEVSKASAEGRLVVVDG